MNRLISRGLKKMSSKNLINSFKLSLKKKVSTQGSILNIDVLLQESSNNKPLEKGVLTPTTNNNAIEELSEKSSVQSDMTLDFDERIKKLELREKAKS